MYNNSVDNSATGSRRRRWLSLGGSTTQAPVPWESARFSKKIAKRRSVFIKEFQTSIPDQIMIQMLTQVTHNYAQHYNHYQTAKKNGESVKASYHAMRLFTLQKWAENIEGYKLFVSATQKLFDLTKNSSKAPYQFNISLEPTINESEIIDAQNLLNLWGMFFEEQQASENFYGLREFLVLIAFDIDNINFYDTKMREFIDAVRQCESFFIGKEHKPAIENVNIDSAVSNKLRHALAELANIDFTNRLQCIEQCKRVKKAMIEACAPLIIFVQNFEKAESAGRIKLEKLFVIDNSQDESQSSSSSVSTPTGQGSLPTSVSLPILGSGFSFGLFGSRRSHSVSTEGIRRSSSVSADSVSSLHSYRGSSSSTSNHSLSNESCESSSSASSPQKKNYHTNG